MLKYVGPKGLYPTSRRAQDSEGIFVFLCQPLPRGSAWHIKNLVCKSRANL